MKRVLFVDDESKILDGIRRMLHADRKRWDMEFAVGGEAALQACEAGSFRYANARNGWCHSIGPHSRPLSRHRANRSLGIFRGRDDYSRGSRGAPFSCQAMQCVRPPIHDRTCVYVAGLVVHRRNSLNRWNRRRIAFSFKYVYLTHASDEKPNDLHKSGGGHPSA